MITSLRYRLTCYSVLIAGRGTFKTVSGTFTVPTPREPSGGSGSHSSSAWVGIDGDTCGNAILQTGIDFTVSGSSTSFDGMSLSSCFKDLLK